VGFRSWPVGAARVEVPARLVTLPSAVDSQHETNFTAAALAA
jgi:hypothetical protein